MDNQLQSLNLTDNDFKLIIDGLDALPSKDLAGDIMGDLLMGMLSDKTNPESQQKLKMEREQKRSKKVKAKEAMQEDIKILQGKLLMLKRYLLERGALIETYDIINHVR